MVLSSEQAPLIYENGVSVFLEKGVRTDQKVGEVSGRKLGAYLLAK